jgi:predicted DNA-binding transcriptional regulator AlpA
MSVTPIRPDTGAPTPSLDQATSSLRRLAAQLGLEALPPTLRTDQAAVLWDVSSWSLYDLVRRGEAPVIPLHLGRNLRWPTAKVLESLGIDPNVSEAGDG